MVNFGFGSASILGIFLAIAGAALYFLRSVRPELSRDHDIFFAAVGLLCGFILLFQGWRLDPILQFGQLMLTGSVIFFAVESIRLRGVATEQAKRNTQIVDDDRPVSSVYQYQAELDELEPIYDRPVRPKIRGTRDTRSTRPDDYEDETPRRSSRPDSYDDEAPRRSNRSSTERLGQGDRTRSNKRRSTRPQTRPTTKYQDDEWGPPARSGDDWDVSEQANTSARSSRPDNRNQDVSPRPKKRRPPQEQRNSRREQEESDIPTDYVDYKPVDRVDDEPDNSANFDDDM